MGRRLEDRRVLVVGAGTRRSGEDSAPLGIGRAIALRAAAEGAAVACANRGREGADATADLIAAQGGRAAVVVADVAVPEECERLAAEALDAFDGLDGLVLNVGTSAGYGLAGTDIAAWDEVLAVNARSHFLLLRALLPHLDPGSSIVFISSVTATLGFSMLPAYDASKAAVDALCRHTAREGGPAIRANAVAAGLIDTPFRRASAAVVPAGASGTSSRVDALPLGRTGTAEEVAAATAFLLSAEASYITGQVLAVDGGLTTAP